MRTCIRGETERSPAGQGNRTRNGDSLGPPVAMALAKQVVYPGPVKPRYV